MNLDGTVSALVDVISGMHQGSVSGLMLFIHLRAIPHCWKIYGGLWPQSIQNLAAIYSLCFKWHMRLTPEKTKSVGASRSRTYAPDYDDFTLEGAELEEVKSLRVLRITIDYKLKFDTHLREIVSKAAWSFGVRRAGRLFYCPRVLKNYFNAYPRQQNTLGQY